MEEHQHEDANLVADELEDDLEVQPDESEDVTGGSGAGPRDASTGLPTGQR
jgi:hypothetical protein